MGRRGRRPHPDILTPREWEVLALLHGHLTNEQIAERLGITLDGAKHHVSEILSKLGVATREEAAEWAPAHERPWWSRLVALPVAAKIVATVTLIAAASGVGLLTWGVMATHDGADLNIEWPVIQTVSFDCPPGAECPATPVWQSTGNYQDAEDNVALTVLSFDISMNSASVSYVLTHENASYVVRPNRIRLIDDRSSEYDVISNTVVAPSLGVAVVVLVFERPPDASQALALVIDELEVIEDERTIDAPDVALAVAFAGNVDSTHPCCYSEGMRIAPESARVHRATLTFGGSSTGGILHIMRDGWDHNVAWHFEDGRLQVDSVPPPSKSK